MCESIGGVSSFGATGIIAHTVLRHAEVPGDGLPSIGVQKIVSGCFEGSYFRAKTARPLGIARRLCAVPSLGNQVESGANLIFAGCLSFSAHEHVVVSDHVIDGKVLLPGVGYAEMVLSSDSHQLILTTIAFLHPFALPELPTRCVLRKTRQNKGGLFEVASRKPGEQRPFVVHASGTQDNIAGVSSSALQTHRVYPAR
jgi:hypothetical protein